MAYSLKSLGFGKVAVLQNGKAVKTFHGASAPTDAKMHIAKLHSDNQPKPQKKGNISEVVAELQSIQDNIGAFELSMVEGYTAEQINTFIESYSSFSKMNEEVQNPALAAWIGRQHYTQKTYAESMDEPVNPGKNDTDNWQAKEQEEPVPAKDIVTRAASTITISTQKAGLYGHGPFGVTRDFETKVEPNPYVGKTQLSGPNEEVEELDEISKKTLGSYINKAHYSGGMTDWKQGKLYGEKGNKADRSELGRKSLKRERGIENAVARLTKEDITESELDEMISEVLGKDAEAGEWINDFVNSDNPKFEGKSKEKRKQMALAAYYAKQNEEVEELDELSKTTLGNYIKDASSDRSGNSFTMGYEAGAGRQPKEKAHEYDAKRRKGIGRAVSKLAKEEVEELDEISNQTLGSVAMKRSNQYMSAKMSSDKSKADGYKAKADKALSKLKNESFAEFIFDGEIIREELTYEINEADKNYDAYFKEMLKKAGINSIADLKTDDAKKEFMNSVDSGFKAKNEEHIIENFMRSDVEDKAEAHKKAGHKVSDIKFSTKDNKPHAEYTVTTSGGDKKKYIYHGTARKLETLA